MESDYIICMEIGEYALPMVHVPTWGTGDCWKDLRQLPLLRISVNFQLKIKMIGGGWGESPKQVHAYIFLYMQSHAYMNIATYTIFI